MSSPLLSDPKIIALLGDLHGNLGFTLEQVDRAHGAGADVIVQLGDFGYWRPDALTRKFLLRLERRLAELPLHFYWLDGNHEDHDRLDARKVDPATGLRTISPHVHNLPRGFRWTMAGRTWMALGGAVSVDKRKRREGRDWWPQEVLSAEDVAHAVSGGPVDVLLTHDAPAGASIPGLASDKVSRKRNFYGLERHDRSRSGDDDTPSFPKDVLAEANAHRDLLRSVVDAVRPRHVWHGHMHIRYSDQIDLGRSADQPDWNGQVHVHGLAHDQGHWANNMALVGPDGVTLVVTG